MVEAPGTAPGSATLIPHDVYRHSRFPDELNIILAGAIWKGRRHAHALAGPGRGGRARFERLAYGYRPARRLKCAAG